MLASSRAPRRAANTRGRDKSLPYEPRQARGQPGNHNLRVITNPCRGRCLHRPGQPCRAANAPGGYGIRPYNGFSAGRASGLPMWPVVAGRHVGEGHAPPANPTPETRGFPGICGTHKMTVGRDALIPPHPAPPRTPTGGINPSPTNHGGPAANRETANPAPETRGLPGICGTYKMTVGRDALIPPHPAAPRTPAGGINPSPTNHGRSAANRENTTSAL